RSFTLWAFLGVLLQDHVQAELAAGEESARNMALHKAQVDALANALEQVNRKQAPQVPEVLKGLFDATSLQEAVLQHLQDVKATNKANKKNNPHCGRTKPNWFAWAEHLVAQKKSGEVLGVQASGTPWEHFVGVVIGNCETPEVDESFIREW